MSESFSAILKGKCGKSSSKQLGSSYHIATQGNNDKA